MCYAERGASFGIRFKNLIIDVLTWEAHIDIPVAMSGKVGLNIEFKRENSVFCV